MAQITQQHKRHLRAEVAEILVAAPGRIDPVCNTHHQGCGGCDLAHADIATQHTIKAAVVRDALVRIGRIDANTVDRALDPTVRTPAGALTGYRTTVRVGVVAGRAGYRRARSHDVIPADVCSVAHPLLEDLLRTIRFDDDSNSEATLRVSDATGERIALVDGEPDAVDVPADVSVIAQSELETGQTLSMQEFPAGRDWQVSAASFFQPGPQVATLLVDVLAEQVGDLSSKTLVDAYAGVGLFAGTLGASAAQVHAVERSGSSTADARVNLADSNATIHEVDVEKWSPTPADVVVADPSRSGLGARGVEVLGQCGAETFVLVSCDTGSLGRDLGLLIGAGYQLDSVVMVDAFADTSHIEVISTLHT